jgi:hypothetical protein
MPAAALALGVLGVAGCDDGSDTPVATATATAPRALPTATQVRDALLTPADLGPGWTAQSVPRQGDPLCGVETTAATAPVRGRAGFRKSPSGPFVLERFVGFPEGGAGAVMSALRAALEDCDETVSESQGTRVVWRVQTVPEATAGDEVLSVRLTTRDAGQGLPAIADQHIFRRGDFVGGVAHISVGDLDPAITIRALEAADRKLFMLAGG